MGQGELCLEPGAPLPLVLDVANPEPVVVGKQRELFGKEGWVRVRALMDQRAAALRLAALGVVAHPCCLWGPPTLEMKNWEWHGPVEFWWRVVAARCWYSSPGEYLELVAREWESPRPCSPGQGLGHWGLLILGGKSWERFSPVGSWCLEAVVFYRYSSPGEGLKLAV